MKSLDLHSGSSVSAGPADATQSTKTTRLGDLLLKGNFITREQLDEALNYQRLKGVRLGSHLIKLGYLTEDQLHAVFSRQFGIASVDLSTAQIASLPCGIRSCRCAAVGTSYGLRWPIPAM